MQSSAFESVFDHFAEFGFASQNSGQCNEMTLRSVGDDLCQSGFACAAWFPKDDRREEVIRFDDAPQEFAFTDDVFLPDLFIQLARPHVFL